MVHSSLRSVKVEVQLAANASVVAVVLQTDHLLEALARSPVMRPKAMLASKAYRSILLALIASSSLL